MSLLKQKKFIVLKYVKLFLKKGYKETHENLIKLTFSFIKKLKKKNPFSIFIDSIQKAKPFCEMRSLKIKGSIKRVPIEIKAKRQQILTMRWLLINTFARNEKTLIERLAKEVLETFLLQSKTIKIRDDLHKIVETNKTFTQIKS